jgi:hypothetical protein
MTNPPEWWPLSIVQTPAGDYDVTVQFADGHQLRLVALALPGNDLQTTIAAGVAAHLRKDRRWTPKRDRGV